MNNFQYYIDNLYLTHQVCLKSNIANFLPSKRSWLSTHQAWIKYSHTDVCDEKQNYKKKFDKILFLKSHPCSYNTEKVIWINDCQRLGTNSPRSKVVNSGSMWLLPPGIASIWASYAGHCIVRPRGIWNFVLTIIETESNTTKIEILLKWADLRKNCSKSFFFQQIRQKLNVIYIKERRKHCASQVHNYKLRETTRSWNTTALLQ